MIISTQNSKVQYHITTSKNKSKIKKNKLSSKQLRMRSYYLEESQADQVINYKKSIFYT